MRSGDLISYTAEEGVRILGEGKFLVSDSFPGNERTKYCLTSKVYLLAHIHQLLSTCIIYGCEGENKDKKYLVLFEVDFYLFMGFVIFIKCRQKVRLMMST